MKILALLALLVASSSAQSMSLQTALQELTAAMRLAEIGGVWSIHGNSDWEVCAFSNELNTSPGYAEAFTYIEAADLYIQLRAFALASGASNWDEWVQYTLKPAVGVHAVRPTCTTLTRSGVVGLRAEIRNYLDDDHIAQTVANLKVQSADFAEFHDMIDRNQVGIHAIRCAVPVQNVHNILASRSVDFDIFYDIFSIIFGWTINDC